MCIYPGSPERLYHLSAGSSTTERIVGVPNSSYYEVVYILFHTGMRISEFCGLTISDIDFEHHLINIDHQLQRSADMTLVIQETKTHAGTRKLPMTADVEQCFRAIIEDRPTPKFERVVDGHSGFLFLDKDCLPLVAMHWEHRLNHMVKRYNDIYRVQMPNITPHVCRHTYCSNQAKAGMNPKTLPRNFAAWRKPRTPAGSRRSSLGKNSPRRNCSAQFNPKTHKAHCCSRVPIFCVRQPYSLGA